MTDLGTGLSVLGSAYGGAKLVEKILGPTAEYIGVGLKDWTEKRVHNVQRIFAKAADKLGDKIEEPGSVPPRVLKEILDEGSFCDNELMAEYFGGVLASSRSGVSRDDRAAHYLKLTTDLSTYQIRFHYVVYATLRQLFVGSGWSPLLNDHNTQMAIYLPLTYMYATMEFCDGEPVSEIILHCNTGLDRLKLITHYYGGSAATISHHNKARGWVDVHEPGICVGPTAFGAEYWMWAVGLGATQAELFLHEGLQLRNLPEVYIPPGAVRLLPKQG